MYKKKPIETPDQVRRWFMRAMEKLWPVAGGSLSLRRGPCIRDRCSACEKGQGHASYALSGRQGDGRFSIYVPDELAPAVQRAVAHGRQLQERIKEAGRRYTVALKQERERRAQKREG